MKNYLDMNSIPFFNSNFKIIYPKILLVLMQEHILMKDIGRLFKTNQLV